MADPIVGTKHAERLEGTVGDDEIFGRGGDDTIVGVSGSDTIHAGAGDDTIEYRAIDAGAIDGGSGFDTLVVTAYSTIRNLDLQSIERLQSTGDHNQIAVDADQIMNRHGENRMEIVGSAGLGDDILIFGDGDVLNASKLSLENWDHYGDVVRLWTDAENVRIVGSDASDYIISYGQGDDWLRGGEGADTLFGGAGDDVFVFDVGSEGVDEADVVAGEDRIRLVFGEDTDLASGKLSADAFHVGAAAADASDRIIYNPETGMLLYDRDGSGDEYEAVEIAKLGRHLDFNHSDIVIA